MSVPAPFARAAFTFLALYVFTSADPISHVYAPPVSPWAAARRMMSSGTAGFKGSRKSSTYAAQGAGEQMAARCIRLGVRAARVQLTGLGQGKRSALRGLRGGGLRFLSLEELTSIPFNGCRAPKKRRL